MSINSISKIRQVNIDNLKLLSKRGNSKTYISEDNKWAIKFATDDAGNTLDDYKRRQFCSQIIENLHINTPKVRDIVCDADGNLALEYEYIEDKISYARKVSNNPENVEDYMKNLTTFIKNIHNTKVVKEDLKSVEEMIEQTLRENVDIFDKERRIKIEKTISKIENTETLLHLDLQPANYILSKKGTMMIDLDTICYGNPIYDLAFFYYIYHFIRPESIELLSRCSTDIADKMWRFFIKHYKKLDSEKEIDDFNEYIVPYSIISAIAMLSIIKKDGVKKFVAENFDKYVK